MAFKLEDFECKDCKKITEILLDSTDEEQVIECEDCGSSNMEKKISVGTGPGGHISWSKWRAQQ